MRGKFFLKMMLALFLLPSVTANAAKTDVYRDAILAKHFTLKYEFVSPPIYRTSNNAELGFKGMTNSVSEGIYGTPHGGIVVVDGDDSYTEVFHDDYDVAFNYGSSLGTVKHSSLDNSVKIKKGGLCNLTKGDEDFTFFWDMKNDKRRYTAHQVADKIYIGFIPISKSNKSVKANDSRYQTPYRGLSKEYGFGSFEMTNALLPLLPLDKILDLPGIPHYEFLDSGSLDNGLTYEDFVSDDSKMFSAVRYYFDGNDMKRIAFASYVKKDGDIEGYTKSVIDVIEFVPTADQSYLSLPAELKDKTKRDNKKDDEDDNESNGESEEDNEE